MLDYTKLSIDGCLNHLKAEVDFNPEHLLEAIKVNPNLSAAFYLETGPNTYRSRFYASCTNLNWVSENVKVPLPVFENVIRDRRFASILFADLELAKSMINNDQALSDAIFDPGLFQSGFYRTLLLQHGGQLFKLTGKNPHLLDFIFKDNRLISEMLDLEVSRMDPKELKINGQLVFSNIAFLAIDNHDNVTALYTHPKFQKCAGSKALITLGKASVDVAMSLIQNSYHKFTTYELFELGYAHEAICWYLLTDEKFLGTLSKDQHAATYLSTLAAKYRSIAKLIFSNPHFCEILAKNAETNELYNILSKWPDLIAAAFETTSLLHRLRDHQYFDQLVATLATQGDAKSQLISSTAALKKTFVVKIADKPYNNNNNNNTFDCASKNNWHIPKAQSTVVYTRENVDWLLTWHRKYKLNSELFECYASQNQIEKLLPLNPFTATREEQSLFSQKKMIPLTNDVPPEDVIRRFQDPNDSNTQIDANPFVNGHAHKNDSKRHKVS